MNPVLSVRNLSKIYATGSSSITVLDEINFEIAEKTSIAIVGPSGSGKTTLLGLCAGLDRPSGGSIKLIDIELGELNEDERAFVRNRHVGFVFQNFQLLPTLTAQENVMIPLELRGEKNISKKAMDLLDRVGLANRKHHYPSQLSGGEQQRVAIARAFIAEPKILFADEPTGNLDAETADKITDLLFSINRELGTTLVLVTHNLQLAEYTGRILRLSGGKILEDQIILR